MRFSLGFSPCPNDTFIFDALVNKKIETENLEFDVVLEDVQTLNQWASTTKLDITKLSFPALFQNVEQYSILSSGAALGRGVGPLLIAKKMVNVPDIQHCKIAIPGEHTTANFLLSFAFPAANNKIPIKFSSIEDAVCNEEVDLGVIIHENRFTYQKKGLLKICDLGEIWEQLQQAPIPLGCIAIKKSIPPEIQKKVDDLIKKSVEYALQNYPTIPPYVSKHAQAMDEGVMRKHIELYVNDYTVGLKEDGREAIERLFKVYSELNSAANPTPDKFFNTGGEY